MVKEDAIKHLEFIQNIITRMANNSFLLKGWTVTLVAALFALAAQNANLDFVYLAFFPIVAFWVLDAYYLRQERLFRSLYNNIRNKDDSIIQSEPFTMNTKPFEKTEKCWLRVMFSRTLSIFYLATLLTVISVIFIVKLNI
jgi:hypothetical protein